MGIMVDSFLIMGNAGFISSTVVCARMPGRCLTGPGFEVWGFGGVVITGPVEGFVVHVVQDRSRITVSDP